MTHVSLFGLNGLQHGINCLPFESSHPKSYKYGLIVDKKYNLWWDHV